MSFFPPSAGWLAMMLAALLATFVFYGGDGGAAARTRHHYRPLRDGLYGPGRLILAGRRMRCGKTRTLVSHKYWAAAGSIPGVIGLNPRHLRHYTRGEQWFIYTHECGHQHIGRSERKADCWAARAGRRQGWLNRRIIRHLCRRLRHDPAGHGYPTGRQRCRIIRRCFARAGRHAGSRK